MIYIKLIWMYISALGTAVFIYPTLHELGHYLAAFLMGAEIVGVSIFPVPYVSLTLENPEAYQQAIIGMAGLILPMLVFFIRPGKLTKSTVVYTLRAINVLAWFLSCVAVVSSRFGYDWDNEDVLQVIECIGGGETVILTLCLIALVTCLCLLIRSKPIGRIMSFF